MGDTSLTFEYVLRSLSQGFGVTLSIFALTLVFAIPLGLVVAFGSMTSFKPLKYLTRGFVWVIRGTPLMLQIFVVYYIPGIVFDVPVRSRMTALTVAFVINYACYFSEIYRGGIESISKGQYEAGAVLGMTKTQVFFRVVLLQVVKRISAPMSNEVITLVKDTSQARVIAVVELIMEAEDIVSIYGAIWPLFFTAIYYLLFVGLLTILFNLLEKKLRYFRS